MRARSQVRLFPSRVAGAVITPLLATLLILQMDFDLRVFY